MCDGIFRVQPHIGRRFKNDTERFEKFFELYIKMTANAPAKKAGKGGKAR